MKKILLEYAFSFFAMWLLLLLVSFILKLWPADLMPWAYASVGVCTGVAVLIAWYLRAVGKKAAALEAEQLAYEQTPHDGDAD
jgi:hypothetical protein